MRNVRKSLAQGQPAVGSWVSSGSPVIAELMAGCGFDFLVVDVEHSAVDLPQTQMLFQAISAGAPDCAPMARLHGVDYALAKRYLDAGARGIIGPLVNTADQARLLVEAAKYPPLGKRGVGYCRANQYGQKLAEHFSSANDEILVAVQIEHIDGVRNIHEILSVKGIDAVFIGPYDLSASMGITGQLDHPEMEKAKEVILSACRSHNMVPGIHVVTPDPRQLLARLKEGFTFIAYSLDITILSAGCLDAIAAMRTQH
jgi:2-dehydro-3-deoxyglucarate aldolase